ncbi:MAG: hypothetical protein QOG84_1397 [Sphingomonadales bacterium]|jgi:hypothetical protein|nr:hypothetical protein [Sphingomonadales bacterium]
MLIERIEAHMRALKMSPSRFGREAVGDPRFVFSLWEGRVPRRATVARVLAYLAGPPFERRRREARRTG